MKAGDELDREGVAGTSEVEDIADLFSELDGDGSGSALFCVILASVGRTVLNMVGLD